MKNGNYEVVLLEGVGSVREITRYAQLDGPIAQLAVIREGLNQKNKLSNLRVVFQAPIDAGKDGYIYSAPVPKGLRDIARKYTKSRDHKYAAPHDHMVKCLVFQRDDGLYVVGMFDPPDFLFS